MQACDRSRRLASVYMREKYAEKENGTYYACSDCGRLFADGEGREPIEEPPIVATLPHADGEASLVTLMAENGFKTGT